MSRYITTGEYLGKVRWCEAQGWTEPFYKDGRWYAFPPGAVIPQNIPSSTYYSFFDLLRALRPSEPRELRSKKLQDFVGHYITKIWLEDKETKKTFVSLKIANFSQSEIIELEGYLEVEIKNLNLKTWKNFFQILILFCIFTGFCLGIVELFSLTDIHLLWIVPLFFVATIWFAKKHSRFILTQIDKEMPYKQLLFFLAHPDFLPYFSSFAQSRIGKDT